MADKKRFYSLFARGWFTAKMAAHGILSKPLRSALTILGVAIGVASVVSLMGIGEGARQVVVEQFESLGMNVVTIEAHDPSVEFDPDEAKDLVERVEGLEMASPVIYTKTMMKWRRARGNAKLVGVNEKFPEIRDHELISGRFFTKWHVEQRSKVAVLGYNIGKGLMGGRSPVGRYISLNGESYRIVGVLGQKGMGNAEDIDEKIIIPYTSALKISEKRTVAEIWGKAASKEDADLVVVQLGRIYRRKLGLIPGPPLPSIAVSGEEGMGGGEEGRPNPEPKPEPEESKPEIPGMGEDLISITSLNQLVEEADNANRVMTLLLGGIAAVSLLVSGLGIMNIMLVAVSERTEEIGVRRALGAKKGDLLFQFLLEALYVSVIGALVGIVVGILGMNAFENQGFETAINLQSIKIATVVAILSGLLFGVYPAIAASSLQPVEALRRQ
jgi:putative ABC transport system permease protein